MNEQVNKEAIALAVKAEKLTEEVLASVIQKLSQEKPLSKGKQSLNSLINHNSPLSNIDVSSKNIRSFKNIASKYSVDFAVKKDNTEQPPKYLIFFKGKDAETINKAFKEFTYKQTHKKPSINKKLQNVMSKIKSRSLQREKQKDRGIEH